MKAAFLRSAGTLAVWFSKPSQACRAAGQDATAAAATTRKATSVHTHLTIEPTRRLVCHPGEFGAEVADNVLRLPELVASSFRAVGARDAIDALSYLEAFPTAIANQLQWNVSDVVHAGDMLKKQLRGHIADELLAPSEPTQRVYGAIKP